MRIVELGPDGVGAFLAVAPTGRDPRDIPPLELVLCAELSGACAFGTYGRQSMWIAEDGDGRALARVAALVHPRVLDRGGVPVGQLGYLEVPDDGALARRLLDAAAGWLRAQGCRTAMGPMNGGAHRLHRALVTGFDAEPFLFEPRNPPHVPRMLEAWGLRAAHHWATYELDREATGALEQRFARILAGRPITGAIDVVDPSQTLPTLARLHGLLDGFWKGHVGYGGLSLEEFAEVFAGALAIMGPRSLGFLVEGGRDVGCAFMYADRAAEVRALAGDAAGWARWPTLPLPARLVMHTLALLPEARGGSGSLALMHHGLRLFREDGHERLVVALVIEGLLGRQLGAPTRTYALYERAL